VVLGIRRYSRSFRHAGRCQHAAGHREYSCGHGSSACDAAGRPGTCGCFNGHTPPTSAITSPSSGSTVSPGSSLTISGTAVDFGGGVVGAVEISLDGGTTLAPAVVGKLELYRHIYQHWNCERPGRAADDSGNLEVPGPGITLTVTTGSPPAASVRHFADPESHLSSQPTSGGTVNAYAAPSHRCRACDYCGSELLAARYQQRDRRFRRYVHARPGNFDLPQCLGQRHVHQLLLRQVHRRGTTSLTLNFSGGSTYLL